MDRYFFHIDYGERSRDMEGTLLPSLAAAQTAALELLGRLLIDEGDDFWGKPNISVVVEDSRGLVLWTVETIGHASAAVPRVG